jgi:hypothetical protein
MTYFLSIFLPIAFTFNFAWILYECYQLRKYGYEIKQAYEAGLKRGYEVGYAQAKHDERMSR